MSVPTEGYGGQCHPYTTGYTRNALTVPPFVPREYSDISANDSCTKLVFKKTLFLTASRGPVGWQRMDTIHAIRYPIGFHGLNKEEHIARTVGYIPLISVFAGLEEIATSMDIVHSRVILNNNFVSEQEDTPHKGAILRTRRIVPVKCCASQRFVILLNALGVFLRGVINVGQLGFVFLPFDRLTYRFTRHS